MGINQNQINEYINESVMNSDDNNYDTNRDPMAEVQDFFRKITREAGNISPEEAKELMNREQNSP